jgi:hypothetical protein
MNRTRYSVAAWAIARISAAVGSSGESRLPGESAGSVIKEGSGTIPPGATFDLA